MPQLVLTALLAVGLACALVEAIDCSTIRNFRIRAQGGPRDGHYGMCSCPQIQFTKPNPPADRSTYHLNAAGELVLPSPYSKGNLFGTIEKNADSPTPLLIDTVQRKNFDMDPDHPLRPITCSLQPLDADTCSLQCAGQVNYDGTTSTWDNEFMYCTISNTRCFASLGPDSFTGNNRYTPFTMIAEPV